MKYSKTTSTTTSGVRLRQIRADEYRAEGPYDAIVLCRSPGYTPASADTIFDAIRREFVEELV